MYFNTKKEFLYAGLIVAVASILIFTRLDVPSFFVFDEVYFVGAAQRYLFGEYLYIDGHPPLAKLLIVLGQILFSPVQSSPLEIDGFKVVSELPDNYMLLGYRFFPALAGVLIPLLFFFIGRILLKDDKSAFMLGLLVVFDNALIIDSRAALLESILVFFILSAILVFYLLWESLDVKFLNQTFLLLIWGIVLAAAFLVKLTGAFVFLLVPLYLKKVWIQRGLKYVVKSLTPLLIGFCFVFFVVWGWHFSYTPYISISNNWEVDSEHKEALVGESNMPLPERFFLHIFYSYKFMIAYHGGISLPNLDDIDEIGSLAFQWPLGGKPILYRWETKNEGETFRIMALIGNPFVWILSLVGIFMGTLVVLADSFLGHILTRAQYYKLAIPSLLYWAYMIPMIVISSNRVMYLYHYLPVVWLGVLVFMLLMQFFSVINWRYKVLTVRKALLFLVIVGFLMYSPFTYNLELSQEQFEYREVRPLWYLKWPNSNDG